MTKLVSPIVEKKVFLARSRNLIITFVVMLAFILNSYPSILRHHHNWYKGGQRFELKKRLANMTQ